MLQEAVDLELQEPRGNHSSDRRAGTSRGQTVTQTEDTIGSSSRVEPAQSTETLPFLEEMRNVQSEVQTEQQRLAAFNIDPQQQELVNKEVNDHWFSQCCKPEL